MKKIERIVRTQFQMEIENKEAEVTEADQVSILNGSLMLMVITLHWTTSDSLMLMASTPHWTSTPSELTLIVISGSKHHQIDSTIFGTLSHKKSSVNPNYTGSCS